LSESKNIAEQIIHSTEGTKEGSVLFSEVYNGKNVIIESNWKGKRLNLKITIEKPYPGSDFIPCEISNSVFLSAIMRYSNFNFKGTVSPYSDCLLSSSNVLKLMTQKNASIELLKRSVIYECKIKNCPTKRLEILIALSKVLSTELDVI